MKKNWIIFAACAMLAQPPALAEESYPGKPIKFVVPFSAGGIADNYARALAREMSDSLDVTIIVENVPGATGQIGTERVIRAAADGHTLLYTSNSALVLAQLVAEKPAFNALTDLTPVSHVIEYPIVLYTNPELNVQSGSELLQLARNRAQSLTCASVGIGSVGHLSCEQFALANGIDLLHVPYKGAAPAQMAVISGEADMTFDSAGNSQKMADAGRLRPVVVLSERRTAAAPDVPTAEEAGMPPVHASVWTALLGPAGMPPAVVETLNSALHSAMQSEELKSRIEQDGSEIAINSAEASSARIRRDQESWKKTISAMSRDSK